MNTFIVVLFSLFVVIFSSSLTFACPSCTSGINSECYSCADCSISILNGDCQCGDGSACQEVDSSCCSNSRDADDGIQDSTFTCPPCATGINSECFTCAGCGGISIYNLECYTCADCCTSSVKTVRHAKRLIHLAVQMMILRHSRALHVPVVSTRNATPVPIVVSRFSMGIASVVMAQHARKSIRRAVTLLPSIQR